MNISKLFQPQPSISLSFSKYSYKYLWAYSNTPTGSLTTSKRSAKVPYVPSFGFAYMNGANERGQLNFDKPHDRL